MSIDILQHRGVVAVCFSCGTEKAKIFAACSGCGAQPRQDDELLDSIILSRYASTEILLSRAVAERSPGVVIKAASRATMRAASNAIRDPQLRNLLGLQQTRPKQEASESIVGNELWVEGMRRVAEQELGDAPVPNLSACLDGNAPLSQWAKTEQLLQSLRAQADAATVETLLEAVLDIAERCKTTSDQQLHKFLMLSGIEKNSMGSAERREVWKTYEQSIVDRIVVSLERVKSDDLIELFLRIETTTERRRDKQPLPITKALLDVYKQHALETLRKEGDNADRLISAIRTNSAEEHDLNTAMVSALESLVENWRMVAMPLAGAIADREVAGLRRELNSELQEVSDHLADKCREIRLSERTSRLALDLL